MTLTHRYRKLTIWNKVAFVGAVASILSFCAWVAVETVRHWPQTTTNAHPTVPAADTATQSPSALLLVDTSASMEGTPVLDAVTAYVRDSPPGTKIGLATFDDTHRLIAPPGRYPIAEYERALRRRPTGPCTRLLAAIDWAAGQLAVWSPAASRLVVFSDGIAEPCPAEPVSELSFEERHPGVSLNVVLLGKGDVAEVRRVFPTATLDVRYAGIGGRVFPKR